MNVKKIPKQKTMEEASLSILKLTLVKYGVFLEKDPFEDTGIDLLVNVPTTKPIEIEDDRLKFLTVTDAFDRRLYGQLKSSQDGKFFISDKKAKFSLEVSHLKMWKNTGRPVIVFLVDLRAEYNHIIYWKHINHDFKIKSTQKTQTVNFNKIIDRKIWKKFDEILNKWEKTKQKGLLVESDTRMNQLVDEFPHFSDLSLLPEFTEFREKREQWERERSNLFFKEFNSVKWDDEMVTETPQVGYRSLVPKTEYARFTDSSIPIIYSVISDEIVRSVFLSEERKLFEDLINYSKNYTNLIVLQEFSEASEKLNLFEDPLLLFSSNNLEQKDFRDKYAKELFALENVQENRYYLKSKLSLGNRKVDAIELPPYSEINGASVELSKLKGMLIDKSHVEYREKIPLKIEWRTPILRATIWHKNKEERIKDSHNFDFSCLTLAEINYTGPMVVWWFSDQI